MILQCKLERTITSVNTRISNADKNPLRTPLLVAYPCEIWQFSLRSRGLTVAWCTAVASIFFNTFVNAIALDALGWKYYIVFAVILFIFIFVVYFAYPETRGHTLEQMALIFDGDDAVPSQTVVLQKGESHTVYVDDVEEKN